jgi:hypothetical protein
MIATPICRKCNKKTMSREERKDELKIKVKDYQENKVRR